MYLSVFFSAPILLTGIQTQASLNVASHLNSWSLLLTACKEYGKLELKCILEHGKLLLPYLHEDLLLSGFQFAL